MMLEHEQFISTQLYFSFIRIYFCLRRKQSSLYTSSRRRLSSFAMCRTVRKGGIRDIHVYIKVTSINPLLLPVACPYDERAYTVIFYDKLFIC